MMMTSEGPCDSPAVKKRNMPGNLSPLVLPGHPRLGI
jgi:hypothetical protein